MKNVLSLFLFFVYKLLILADLKYWLGFMPLRIEKYMIYFYFVLSLFQFLFIIYCIYNFSKESKKKQFLPLMDNFSSLITMMEIANLAFCGLFLTKIGNDFYRVYFIFLTTFLLHLLFYMLFRINSYLYLKGSFVETFKIGIGSRFVFNFVVFSLTVLYIFLKVFKEKKFFPLDVGLTICIMTLCLLVFWFLEVLRVINLKRFNPLQKSRDFETAYLQTLFKKFEESRINEQDNIFSSDYISNTLRDDFLKKGLSIESKEYKVTLLSVRIKIDDRESESERLKDFVRTMGFFAREYDAFPFFGMDYFLLIFGFPIDFEHRAYNAIEVAERLIKASSRLENGEGGKYYIFAGICEGSIKAYLLPLRNSKKNDVYLRGEGIDFADKISNIAYREKIPLLVSDDFYTKMKNRIFVSRVLKVKDKEEEKTLYQVRL